MLNETIEAPRRGRPPKSDSTETIKLLLLRGYVPKEAVAVTFEPNGKPASLEKYSKGQVVLLPKEEGIALIRRGSAVRPDEASDNQLIQAGLKQPPEPDDEDAD